MADINQEAGDVVFVHSLFDSALCLFPVLDFQSLLLTRINMWGKGAEKTASRCIRYPVIDESEKQ